MISSTSIGFGILSIATVLLIGTGAGINPANSIGQAEASFAGMTHIADEERTMQIYYLEVVTPSVNETCEVLAKAHGVVFGQPVAELGNARTAELTDGGRIGVRAPMRETEQPVVRPYVLVSDIGAAVQAAEARGAEIAIPPMEIPGQGTFSIYILGGIEHGLWQH